MAFLLIPAGVQKSIRLFTLGDTWVYFPASPLPELQNASSVCNPQRGATVHKPQPAVHHSNDQQLPLPMARQLITSGSSFEQEIGYSRAVVDGDWIFVSGCTGFDYATMSIADDLAGQTEQAMRNIESALTQAGASLQDIVRVLYVIVDAGEFSQCWPVLRKYLGEVHPAAVPGGA